MRTLVAGTIESGFGQGPGRAERSSRVRRIFVEGQHSKAERTYLPRHALDGVVVHLTADDRTVCLHDNIVLLAVLDNILLLA